ncbi:tRNA-i(6)A37 methylthiotransferase [invertebrate metagenome]|uniref:tRNA-i(6)A37 methylthiotransferase n=1 Tax=invertebrate metagenome TaxID=1711999 RepID=A0A484H5P2_9ZZZZ
MNSYDSARMADILAPFGFIMSDRPDDADMIILTTCHIREKASEKLFSDLGRLRSLKEARRASGGMLILVVAGCVAQANGAALLERAPYVDIVLGTQSYYRLPEIVLQKEKKILEIDFPQESKFHHLPPPTANGIAVFLPVQEGCDKFCTFCVVPYTRGAEYSRPVAAVLADASDLVATGAKEITLLGQNVNTYRGMSPDGTDSWGLGRLLQALARIDGLYRLRFITSHPRDIDDELIEAFQKLPQLMPYLHLPIQSGSDRILAAMNRGHTVSYYYKLVDKLRNTHPKIALSSDFIVGFPGETEADFTATLDLVQRVGYAQAYAFKFSPRPGTPAAQAPDQIPEVVKADRLARLQNLLSTQQRFFNTVFLGREVPVLLDRRGTQAGQMIGRSPYMQVVTVRAPDYFLGQIVNLRIDRIRSNSLDGTLVNFDSIQHEHTINKC